MRILLVACLLSLCVNAMAQVDTTRTLTLVNNNYLSKLGAEYDHLSEHIHSNSIAIINNSSKIEDNIFRKIMHKDSAAGAKLRLESAASYQQIEAQLTSKITTLSHHSLKDYLPGVDSLQTALQFLQGRIPSPSLRSAQEKLLRLENNLQQSNMISAFLEGREAILENSLRGYGLAKQLTTYQQQVYYYKARVHEYRNLLYEPDNAATKVLALARNIASFQRFFQQNSYLSKLFLMPGKDGGSTSAASLQGLQTKEQVSAIVTERLGSGANFATAVTGTDNNGSNPLTAGTQQAKGIMDTWKDKLSQSSCGSSRDPAPDFTPNTQHNKTFWHRLELGLNFQSTGNTLIIPATSDLAVTLGYKLSDKAVAGAGASYKVGWGQPFNHVSLSSQGAGLRSYLEVKWKATWWITGGLEYNYYNALLPIPQIANLRAWQSSGLLGLTKKFTIRGRQNNVQLLYDLLHAQHLPHSQPVIFRFGYTL